MKLTITYMDERDLLIQVAAFVRRTGQTHQAFVEKMSRSQRDKKNAAEAARTMDMCADSIENFELVHMADLIKGDLKS